VRARARDLGIVVGTLDPGPNNAITDVPETLVGHTTIIEGDGALRPGLGPIRTGVTVILPHGRNVFDEKVVGAVHVVNGFGKSAGLAQVAELGTIESPIGLTNTLNVGLVLDALVEHVLDENPDLGTKVSGSVNVVVGECNDSFLNDIRGRHVKAEHVRAALAQASAGTVEEGAVGAGTGMSCFEFKGGIGTSSRVLPIEHGGCAVGVLVLSNFGRKPDLTIDGIPVGRELAALESRSSSVESSGGSIMMVLGTNAPLSSRQLGRVARRCAVGLARTGSFVDHGSGDFVIAYGIRCREAAARAAEGLKIEESGEISWLFRAAAEATEEAILNSMLQAETVVGRDGNTREALPIDKVLDIMRQHRRITG
jgi:D-aminopeptidase